MDVGALRILLVEDNRQMADLVRMVLAGLDITRVEQASTLESAWRQLQRRPFDIVILDRNLQGSDGLDLARRIRDAACAHPRVAILMLTASAEQRVVAAARDAGVNEFLVKPFTVAALAKRLSAMVLDPRPFVSSGTYFGPDRRRRADPRYQGPERRKTADRGSP